MAAASKRAKKIRFASDFDPFRLAGELRAPKQNVGAYAWDLDAIKAARDLQMLGNFLQPARLVEAMRTDDALFVAFLNRLAPQRGLPIKLVPPNQTARALRVADESEALFGPKGVGIHPDSLTYINGCLANHGLAFGVNSTITRDDGSRVDLEHRAWPIEWVRWDTLKRSFVTRVEDATVEGGRASNEVDITHGDGRWVVYRVCEIEPWKYGCVLPGALLWADHAFGRRDRSRSSLAHGNAKVVGTMPQDVPVNSPEGMAYLELLKAIASVDTPVGIKPFGAALDYITNNSQAWQIFKEIIESGDKSASRIYLGQDGLLGQTSGSPGVSVAELFGVRNDIVEGDLKAIERGLLTGVIEPWCAMNFGDSALAPSRVYLMPDKDDDARRANMATNAKAFFDIVQQAKEAGFDADQAYIDSVAADFDLIAPTLPKETNKAPTITLAPTDIARVVLVNEARASAGLGPLQLKGGVDDPDGWLTVEEFSAKKAKAANTAPTDQAPVEPSSETAAPAPAT